ncbi:MAG: M48 family metallopeptidase [Bdellovibrionales bacterium]
MIFLTVVNASWIAAAWLFLERESWLWITPVALSINFLLLTYDQVFSFNRLKIQPLLGHDPWGLLRSVHELSVALERPVPQVFLVEHPSAHLFSYGRTGRRARLFVTVGALDLLSPGELRAVLMFQMMVMQSSFSILNYWLGAIIDLFYRLGRAIERAFAFVFGWSPPLAAWFVSPWAWLLHKLLLSPRDFQHLDRATASRIQNPEDLARALWKMEAYAQTQPWSESWAFAHMCMVSPLSWKHVLKVLRIQPPVRNRIQALTGRYPL